MELRNCEYCGTAYDARLSQCPLCGRTAGGQKAPAQPQPRQRGKIPALIIPQENLNEN